MVDNINLQKLLIPVSSPRKIKALDHKQSNMQDRQFKGHLEKAGDEDKKNDKEARDKNDDKETSVNKQKRGTAEKDDHQNLVMSTEKNDCGSDKLIDILV